MIRTHQQAFRYLSLVAIIAAAGPFTDAAEAADDVVILAPAANNSNMVAYDNAIFVRFNFNNGFMPSSVEVKSADGKTSYGRASGPEIYQVNNPDGTSHYECLLNIGADALTNVTLTVIGAKQMGDAPNYYIVTAFDQRTGINISQSD